MIICSTLQMALLAIIIVVFHSSIILHNVDAYQTFELVEYCQRFDSKIKLPEETRNDDIFKSGLVVESNRKYRKPEKFEKYDFDEEELAKIDHGYVGKTVTIDAGYDTSAVRLIVDPENVFRAHLRCSILLMPKKPNGLIVALRKLRVRPGTDWLRISINNSSFTRTFSHIRINGERDSVAYVAHHGVLIEFGTKKYLPKEEQVEIELILTSFREADLCDIDQEFDCGSFRCISNNYVCDGYNNCGDGRDESNCPMDNITNYLIISTTLLLVAFLIFLCFCYRCCFQKKRDHHVYNPSLYRKQYKYLRIRTNSVPPSQQPFLPKYRSQSVQSETDLSTTTIQTNNLRRVKFTHVGDSMPVLIPTVPPVHNGQNGTNYGSIAQTYFHIPYQPYTIALEANGVATNRIGLITLRPSTSGQQEETINETTSEHHTFPLPQPSYPMLHPQLFTPPLSHTPPPPPYTPRDPCYEQQQQQQTLTNNRQQQPEQS